MSIASARTIRMIMLPDAERRMEQMRVLQHSFLATDRTFTCLELGPFAACTTVGVVTGCATAAGGVFVAAVGLVLAGAAGVTFAF